MAISSKSIIHKPLEYTQPVDLNLLGKVLQFKQGQFDSGTKQVQSHFDAIASMDVVKDSDREYLNAKLSNLVNSVNSIGGADFSDPNVTNQISGLSSQIYGDDHVVSAVANTKKFRYVQNFYKEMKEKKPKDWNPANEWYDMQKFNGWLSDGQVGTQPEGGAGKVTPFVDYEKDWRELFGKITANMKTEITDKGLMYRLDTHKYVSPEQIWDAAQKLLTPAQRQQLGVEGRYTYQGLPVHELTKAYDEKIYNQVGLAKQQLEDYQAKYKGATDIKDQERYQTLIAEKENEINSLLAPIKNNAEQIKEKLYLNEKLSGLASRYSYNQSTTKLQAATDKMFVMKHNQDVAEFQYKQRNDALDRQVEMAKEGLVWSTDAFGNTTAVIDPNSPVWKNGGKNGKGTGSGADAGYGNLIGLDNSDENQKVETTKVTLDQRKTDLVQANDKLFKEFITDLGRKKGLTDVIIDDLLDDGHLRGAVSPEMQKVANEMMNSWNAMTRGEKINFETLDPLFKSFVGKYQQNLKEIQAVDKFYENIDKQVEKQFGLTTADVNVAKTYQKYQNQLAAIDAKYPVQHSTVSYGLGGGSTSSYRPNQAAYEAETAQIRKQMADLEPFVKGDRIQNYLNNRETERNKLINSASVRVNLPTMNQGDDKDKNVAKMIASNAKTMQWYNADGVAQEKNYLNFENVEVMSKGYDYLKTAEGNVKKPVVTFKYKTGTGADDWEVRKVPLNETQAMALGFGTEVKEMSGYDFGLNMNGEVNDINTTSGKTYELKYDLVKYNVTDRNDSSVFIRVKKGNNVISLYNAPFPSYEQAVQFMESQAAYKSADEAFTQLEAISKR